MGLELDGRNKLADLLARSGKAHISARRALYLRIEVRPNTSNFINGGSDRDFATELVDFLYQAKRYKELIKLCEEIEPELGDNLKLELEEIRDRVQQLIDSLNQQNKRTTKSKSSETSARASDRNQSPTDTSGAVKPSQIQSGKFVNWSSRGRNVNLDEASVEDKLKIFREALQNMEEAIAEKRMNNRLGQSFKKFIEKDLRPDLKYIIREIKSVYRNRARSPIDIRSLEKIVEHLNDAVDRLNAAMDMERHSQNPEERHLMESYRDHCRRCERHLYEAQLLLETP